MIIFLSRTVNSTIATDSGVNPILVPIGMAVMLLGLKKHKLLRITPLTEKQSIAPSRFKVHEGSTYLALEVEPTQTFFTFSEIVHHGHSGLCITRIIPETVQNAYNLEKTPIIWLINEEGENTIHPRDIQGLFNTAKYFLQNAEKGVIILHGLEYLVLVNGFEKVFTMIVDLKKIAAEKRAILITMLVPGSLNDRDEAILKSQCKPIFDKELPPL